jgi:hypothetical protein
MLFKSIFKNPNQFCSKNNRFNDNVFHNNVLLSLNNKQERNRHYIAFSGINCYLKSI